LPCIAIDLRTTTYVRRRRHNANTGDSLTSATEQ
jgi:hypothetical protein